MSLPVSSQDTPQLSQDLFAALADCQTRNYLR